MFGRLAGAGWGWGWTSQPSQPVAVSSQPPAHCIFLKVQIMAPTVAHADFNISNSNYQPCHDHAEFEIPANNNRFNHESTVHMLHPHNTQSTFVPWIHNNLYNTVQFHSPSVDTQSPRYWISFHMMPIKLFSRVLRTIKFHHIILYHWPELAWLQRTMSKVTLEVTNDAAQVIAKI